MARSNRKIHYSHYRNLWSDVDFESRKSLSFGKRETVLRKNIDNICMSADMSETVENYAKNLCDGVVYLYSVGFKPSEIIKHNVLLQKLLSLGRDILEKTHEGNDLFYIGAMIDLKVTRSWKDIKFFKFILRALGELKDKMSIFTQNIKYKIQKEYKLYFPEDFHKFFLIPLKSTA